MSNRPEAIIVSYHGCAYVFLDGRLVSRHANSIDFHCESSKDGSKPKSSLKLDIDPNGFETGESFEQFYQHMRENGHWEPAEEKSLAEVQVQPDGCRFNA